MEKSVKELQSIAVQIRKDIVEMVTAAASGHPGGSLSAADIMTVLYFGHMQIDPANPQWEERDRFVLSKGHAAPVLYSTLARRGYFDPETLKTLRKINSKLQGHPDMRKVPGVDMSTGSLGQGISAAVGMALSLRMDKKSARVFALLGDGELNEGLVWEAAMAASHYKLSNLVAILDYNGLQIDGANEDVMGISPVDEKWRSFGWHVLETDGHDMEAIIATLKEADKADKPVLIIARTVKGKGVSYMENQVGWHGKAPSSSERDQAIQELEA